ncbi:OmpA family protein [Fulvivirgaceae bacterium LMO-SS25]
MRKFALFFTLFTTLTFASQAQQELGTNNKRAASLYVESENYVIRRQYPQAISLLNQALNRDYKFAEAHLRLATCYRAIEDNAGAIKHFTEVIKLKPQDPRYSMAYFVLAEINIKEGKYDEAIELLNQHQKIAPKGNLLDEGARMLQNAQFAMQAINNPVEFNPEPLSSKVNVFQLQYFPVLTADEKTLFFTARNGNARTDDEDIFISTKDNFGDWTTPESISRNINTRFNEGTCSISADGRMMIFTACEGRQGYGSCDLYVTYKIGEEWSVPNNLGPNINSPQWDSQPSLSADGNTLYFVSNRPGGIGNRDIYVSYRNEAGDWTMAQNLGEPLNTSSDEVSPFIHANGLTFFFASNGHPGFGGFDLFSSEIDVNNQWGVPKNVGYPINTSEDQVSLFIAASGTTAYYANEKKQGNQYVDSKIYSFELPPQLQVTRGVNYVKGRVVDAITQRPIVATVELYDLETDELSSRVKSDSLTGEYLITLTKGSEYALYVNKNGYLFDSRYFSFQEDDSVNPELADILLNKINRGESVNLNNIFFDFDKFVLREKSKTELKKIIAFLNAYPDIKIEIEGHTDNVGSAQYNLELSRNRALSVYEYLLENGIADNRVYYKGYGMEKPIATNETEEGRQQNRRIAFKIL